ncbi:MAG: ATP-binding protein, partial [Desulfobulbaceae bacterium]|nr:ATP-binding protein [Desulfobulbaceae bacterium]
MNYLKLIDLEKEPFANSPDPDFFFASDQHMRVQQRLELAIRLRKGLSVALGEVGTGKTTLCRRLIRRLGKVGGQVSVHLLLDPEFVSGAEFLRAIIAAFGLGTPAREASERELKETVKQHLLAQGVDGKKITVLIIDEGQKLPGFCLEILREFLNFETNRHKLLQIVIFAQLEFRQALRERANFSDRIAELCTLTPLNFA